MDVSVPQIKTVLQQMALDEGFKKKNYWFYKEGKYPGIRYILSMPCSTYSDCRTATAYVGIQHVPTSELYLKLIGMKTRDVTLTINQPIGYLMPVENYKDWIFTSQKDIVKGCKSMFDDIRKYGYPFYEKNGSVPRLIEILEKDELHLGREWRFYFLPLLYLAVHQKEKGIAFFEELRSETGFFEEHEAAYYDNYCKYCLDEQKL